MPDCITDDTEISSDSDREDLKTLKKKIKYRMVYFYIWSISSDFWLVISYTYNLHNLHNSHGKIIF